MRIWERWAIRTRLTVLYAGAFFLAGAILIALMQFYLAESLNSGVDGGALTAAQQLQGVLGGHGLRNHPMVDEVVNAMSAQAKQQRHDTLQTMLIFSLVSLGAVGLAAGGLGWLLAGRVLQPLHEVTATARRVAERNLHERISLDGPNDEIKELADTFDAMLERLDRAFDGQHRFVANASHELRTPLAINRTLIEVALDDPAAPEATRQLGTTLLQVNQRHERLIDGLLVLASSEQQINKRMNVDLAEVARWALSNEEGAARRAGIDLVCHLQSADVVGDPALLERVAQNLIDNALRYNISGRGWVAVSVSADTGFARLAIENTGPVVSPDEVNSLFEPFRRLATTPGTGGAGLGLSIVRSVTIAHGGRVSATSRPDGGLLVEVTLPMNQ